MNVDDVMTTEVLTVAPEASLKEAAALLARRKVSGLPVVDQDGRVIGVLSEGDILFKELGGPREQGVLERWLALPLLDDPRTDARTVREAMSAPAITIAAKRALTEAATAMVDEGVNRLPVVDAEGKLVGIVTRADLIRAFVRSDEEISAEISEDVIQRTLWIAPESIAVTVENGEVRLSGEVETKSDAELIPAFVRRVPGVVSVLSELRWRSGDGHRREGRMFARHER